MIRKLLNLFRTNKLYVYSTEYSSVYKTDYIINFFNNDIDNLKKAHNAKYIEMVECVQFFMGTYIIYRVIK